MLKGSITREHSLDKGELCSQLT